MARMVLRRWLQLHRADHNLLEIHWLISKDTVRCLFRLFLFFECLSPPLVIKEPCIKHCRESFSTEGFWDWLNWGPANSKFEPFFFFFFRIWRFGSWLGIPCRTRITCKWQTKIFYALSRVSWCLPFQRIISYCCSKSFNFCNSKVVRSCKDFKIIGFHQSNDLWFIWFMGSQTWPPHQH